MKRALAQYPLLADNDHVLTACFEQIPLRTVNGRVSASDNPEQGLSSCVLRAYKDNQFINETISDENGFYTFTQLPPIAMLFIEASINNYESKYYENKLDISQKDKVNINFLLNPIYPYGISGRIVNELNGISGQKVSAYSALSQKGSSTFSDENGYYTITNLDPDFLYVVSVVDEDLNHEFFYTLPDGGIAGQTNVIYSAFSANNAFPVAPDFPFISNIDIIASMNQGQSIAGHIYRKKDNEPVHGVKVHAWSEALQSGNWAISDENGAYSISGLTEVKESDASSMGYEVFINDDDFVKNSFADIIATGLNGIDLYLKDYAQVTGTITDENGNPLAGAKIVAFSLTNNNSISAVTGFDGTYFIDNIPIANDYIIALFRKNCPVIYYPDKNEKSDAQVFDLTKEALIYANMISTCGASIKGKIFIRNSSSPAPKGIRLSIWSLSEQSVNTAFTNDDGTYIVTGLDPNLSDYIIAVQDNAYAPAYYRDNNDENLYNDTVYDRKMASNVSPSDIMRNIILLTGYSVSGKVSCLGEAVSDVDISAVSLIGKMTLTAHTNEDGYYNISGIIPGTYLLTASAFDYINSSFELDVFQNVINTDFSISKAARSIAGTVVGIPENSKAEIVAESFSANTVKSSIITGKAEAINYKINGLIPASDYSVKIISDAFSEILYEKLIDLSIRDKNAVDFTVSSEETGKSSISGYVNFPENAEINESVLVEVFSEKSNFYVATSVKYNNEYSVPYIITGLSTGSYLVKISSDKYIDHYYENAFKANDSKLINLGNAEQFNNVNFVLENGKSISGHLFDENKQTISGISISAFSKDTSFFDSTITDEFGYYNIKGLMNADDYQVSAFINKQTYYYNYSDDDDELKSINFSENVDISIEDAVNIDIIIPETASISGKVIDIYGNPIKNIWLDAESLLLNTGNSTFSDSDGLFSIKGLLSGSDYEVRAVPDNATGFLSCILKNVSTNTNDLLLILEEKTAFVLSGKLMDGNKKPVESARVEIQAASKSEANAWTVSDANGSFSIKGLIKAYDYVIIVFPLESSNHAIYRQEHFVMEANKSIDIILSPAFTLSGDVVSEENNAIDQVKITLYSKNIDFWKESTSNENGQFIFYNLPYALDYQLSAIKEGYLVETLQDQIPEQSIRLFLKKGGIIKGKVIEESTGLVSKNAVVEVKSRSGADFSASSQTDNDGEFLLSGLPVFDKKGAPLNDYILSVFASGYPQLSIFNLSPENESENENLEIFLRKNKNFAITGTVINTELHDILIDIFDIDKNFVQSQLVLSDNSFSIEALSEGETCFLRFASNINSTETIIQWLGVDGKGVDNAENALAVSAGNEITFSFNPHARKFYNNFFSQGPAPVINIQSQSHYLTHVKLKGRTDIQAVTPDRVSANPNVTLAWEEPDEDVTAYYSFFTDQQNYEFSKENSSLIRPIKTRKITSSDLNGDDVLQYFHVAPVDREGRIGQTTTIAFRIDTVAPGNVQFIAPETTSNRFINLTLGATGATEVYISNLSYDGGGQWENSRKNMNWELSAATGIKKIYAVFRDRAANSVQASTNTEFIDPLSVLNIEIISGENGHVSPEGSLNVNKGEDLALTISADPGYKIASATLDNKAVEITNNQYAFNNISADHEFKIQFKKISHNIHISSSEHGQVYPNGSFTVYEGNDVSINITPDESYGIKSFILNGIQLNFNGSVYTIENVTQDHTLEISFAKIYTINASSGLHGSVSPAGSFAVAEGAIKSVILMPDPAYVPSIVTVDGNPVKLNGDRYTFLNIDADHSLHAEFEPGKYIITAASGPHGSISPKDKTEVIGGARLEFVITADSSYEINQLRVDGEYIDNPNNSWIFENINSNHSISVTFRMINKVPIANDSEFFINEDTILSENLVAYDPDQDSLHYELSHETTKGIVSLNPLNGDFIYTPQANVFGVDSFSFYVTDDFSQSEAAQVIINITGINDPPIANNAYLETAEEQSLSNVLSANDIDSQNITFRIVNNGLKGKAVITDENTGAFTYTPYLDMVGTDTFSFIANDGELDSQPAIITIFISDDKDAPIAYSSSITVTEDIPYAYTLLGADVDGDSLSYSIVTNGNKGNANLLNIKTGAIIYTPARNQTGEDVFYFKVNDGSLYSAPAKIDVYIVPVNDAPIAYNRQIETGQGSSVMISLTATDVDNDKLSYLILEMPEHGDLSGIPPYLQYVPHEDYRGNDVFKFQVSDAKLTSNLATINILISAPSDVRTKEDNPIAISLDEGSYISILPKNGELTGNPPNVIYSPNKDYNGTDSFSYIVSGKTKTTSINVIPVNDPPFFKSMEEIIAFEGQEKLISIKAGDPDEDVLFYTAFTPLHGSITGTGPDFYYTSHDNYSGEDQLIIELSDGQEAISKAVKIIVNAINDAPLVTEQEIILSEDNTINITLKGTDPENDDLSFIIIQNPEHGSLSGDIPYLTYEPHKDYFGSDRFVIRANDGFLNSPPGVIWITVNPVNDPPVAKALTITANEDEKLEKILECQDVDSPDISYNLNSQTKSGLVNLINNTGEFSYNPYEDFFGIDSFKFSCSDGYSSSEPANVTIFVAAINDAPIAKEAEFSTQEDNALSETLVAKDSDSQLLYYQLIANPQKGQIILQEQSGAFIYTPNTNAFGNDSFTYKASDGQLSSNNASISIYIMPVNDAPLGVSFSLTTVEDQQSQSFLKALDPDNDTELNFAISENPKNGDLTLLSSESGEFVYMPNENFFGIDEFYFTVSDAMLTSIPTKIIINVTALNDKPIAYDVGNIETAKNTPVLIPVTAFDQDGDTLSFVQQMPPFHGKLSPNSEGFLYEPDAPYWGEDMFTFRVCDQQTCSDVFSAWLWIDVKPADIITSEDSPVLIILPSAKAYISKNPEHGTISVNGTSITYSPDKDYTGYDKLLWKQTDSDEVSEFTIYIKPVNDPPVFSTEESFITAEDVPLDMSINIIDPDNSMESLQYTILQIAAHGNLSANANNLRYTPHENYYGFDSFIYSISDSESQAKNININIQIQPVNDPPQPKAQVININEDASATIILSATDIDNEASHLFYKIINEPQHGVITGTPPQITYKPYLDYFGTDTITFIANDGQNDSNEAAIIIQIKSINDVPVAYDDTIKVTSNKTFTGYLKATDLDGTYLLFVITKNPKKGEIIINDSNTGKFTYTPYKDQIGTDSLSFKVFDKYSESNQANVDVQIGTSPVLSHTLETIIQSFNINTEFRYIIINAETGENTVDEIKNESHIKTVLNPGKYRMIIIAKGYQPFEYQYNYNKVIDLTSQDQFLPIQLTPSSYNPLEPVLDISETEIENGFKLHIKSSNLQSDCVLMFNNKEIKRTSANETLYYQWTKDLEYSTKQDNSPQLNDTTYNIAFEIMTENNLIQKYTATFIDFYSETNALISSPPEQKAFEQVFGTTQSKTKGKRLFYPLEGVSFEISIKDENGNEQTVPINIPPLSTDYLFIDDSDASNSINSNNNLKYNSASDFYDIKSTNPGYKKLEPSDQLCANVIFYTFDDSAPGTGINLYFTVETGMYAGNKVLFNPIMNSNKMRWNEIHKETLPNITLPILLSQKALANNNIINTLQNNIMPALVNEQGDGVDGFQKESLVIQYKDNKLLYVNSKHLTAFAVDVDDSENDDGTTAASNDASSGGCFINVLGF